MQALQQTAEYVLSLLSVACRSCLLAWMSLCVWSGTSALAAEQAEIEYAKGLVAYEERNYLEALDHFRLVIDSDPANPHAHFYLGLSFSRLGEFPEAILALNKVLQLDSSLRYVHYHLGMAYFQETRYPEALDQFTLAAQFDPHKATTQLYLGYTYHLLQRHKEALPFLQRAIELDPALRSQAQYYQGIVLYTLERDAEAREAFKAVIIAEPGSTMAGNAQRYMETLASRERETRLWQVEADVSLQYDDNVVLESNGEVVDFGRQADGSTVFTFGAQFLPVRTPLWRLGVEYDLFQSLHFTLHDFDIQSHTGTLFARFKWNEVIVRLAADYTYTLLDAARFTEEVSVLPSVTFWESPNLYTVASARYRTSNFFNQQIPPGQEAVRDRDGWTTRAGFDQYLLLNSRRSAGRFSYHFELSRNDGTDWEYNAHQISLGLQTPLWWDLTLNVDGSYQNRNYLHVNSFDAIPLGVLAANDRQERLDNVLIGSVALSRNLGRYLALSVTYVHTSHLSNIDFFDYRRNFTTLTLSGRY
jgi:lipoprotein NlpI